MCNIKNNSIHWTIIKQIMYILWAWNISVSLWLELYIQVHMNEFGVSWYNIILYSATIFQCCYTSEFAYFCIDIFWQWVYLHLNKTIWPFIPSQITKFAICFRPNYNCFMESFLSLRVEKHKHYHQKTSSASDWVLQSEMHKRWFLCSVEK